MEERQVFLFNYIIPFRPAFERSQETQKQTYFMNAKVSACLWGAIELHFLWNKVFFYLADLRGKNPKTSQIKLMTFCILWNKENGVLHWQHRMTSYTRPPLKTKIQVIRSLYIDIYRYLYTVFTIELVPNINKPSTGVLLGPQIKHVLPVVLQTWYVWVYQIK